MYGHQRYRPGWIEELNDPSSWTSRKPSDEVEIDRECSRAGRTGASTRVTSEVSRCKDGTEEDFFDP